MNKEDQNVTDEQVKEWFSKPLPDEDRIAFFLDEHISMRVYDALSEADIPVTTVDLEGLSGEKSDFRVLARATELGMVLVAADRDFREIHNRIVSIDGASHAGIIHVINKRTQQRPELLTSILSRYYIKTEGWGSLLNNVRIQV